jgi:UDP:flavonoid glycosyltransferase YjiC (YdhE family)
MRILISGVPGHGHLLPLLPLARAFRRRGDSVAIMVPPPYVPVSLGEDIEARTLNCWLQEPTIRP